MIDGRPTGNYRNFIGRKLPSKLLTSDNLSLVSISRGLSIFLTTKLFGFNRKIVQALLFSNKYSPRLNNIDLILEFSWALTSRHPSDLIRRCSRLEIPSPFSLGLRSKLFIYIHNTWYSASLNQNPFTTGLSIFSGNLSRKFVTLYENCRRIVQTTYLDRWKGSKCLILKNKQSNIIETLLVRIKIKVVCFELFHFILHFYYL